MQRILLLLGITTLVSCSLDFQPIEQPETVAAAPRSEVRQNLGERVVQELRARYTDTRANCGIPARPSYTCNGLIIRGTTYSPDYHVWNNSPDSHRKGAVSFAYLRRDAVFTTFNVSRTNGYIFQAYDFAGHKITPEVLCGFPADGFTSLREGTGCGADPGYPSSGPCQEQKIFTAQEWLKHVEGPDGYRAMCGFDVRLSLNQGAWSGFDENNKARNLLAVEYRYGSNELRLQVWPDQDGSSLPLQAFFYLQRDQTRHLGASTRCSTSRTSRIPAT